MLLHWLLSNAVGFQCFWPVGGLSLYYSYFLLCNFVQWESTCGRNFFYLDRMLVLLSINRYTMVVICPMPFLFCVIVFVKLFWLYSSYCQWFGHWYCNWWELIESNVRFFVISGGEILFQAMFLGSQDAWSSNNTMVLIRNNIGECLVMLFFFFFN